jgi:hypothetical protein
VSRSHIPQTPSWECQRCGKDWPCDPGREELALATTRTELARLSWAIFWQAAEDMPTVPAPELFDRFVRWTWSIPSP